MTAQNVLKIGYGAINLLLIRNLAWKITRTFMIAAYFTQKVTVVSLIWLFSDSNFFCFAARFFFNIKMTTTVIATATTSTMGTAIAVLLRHFSSLQMPSRSLYHQLGHSSTHWSSPPSFATASF